MVILELESETSLEVQNHLGYEMWEKEKEEEVGGSEGRKWEGNEEVEEIENTNSES